MCRTKYAYIHSTVTLLRITSTSELLKQQRASKRIYFVGKCIKPITLVLKLARLDVVLAVHQLVILYFLSETLNDQ